MRLEKIYKSLAAMLIVAVGICAQTTHTWNGSGNLLDGLLANGDVITIAAGATGILTMPESAEITITSAGENLLDNGSRSITIDIPATSKVIWTARYVMSTPAPSAGGISISGSGEFEVAGGVIRQELLVPAISRTTGGTIIVSGGMVQAEIGLAINSAGQIVVSGGLVSAHGTAGGTTVIGSVISRIPTGEVGGTIVAYIPGRCLENNTVGLYSLPAGTVFWDFEDNISGIRYADNRFFPVAGVTIGHTWNEWQANGDNPNEEIRQCIHCGESATRTVFVVDLQFPDVEGITGTGTENEPIKIDSLHQSFENEEDLLDYLRSLLTFSGTDGEETDLKQRVEIILTFKRDFEIDETRNFRSLQLLRYRLYLLTIQLNNPNPDSCTITTNINDLYIIVGLRDDGNSSIRNRQSTDGRFGILLENAVVSDFARISVLTPEPATVNLMILDNLGNVVFSATGVGAYCIRPAMPDERTTMNNVGDLGVCNTPLQNAIVWNLTNPAGRFVANGAYLIIAEVTTITGKRYLYQAKIGVKR